MAFGIFSELGFGEKGIEIEREDSELGLWKNFTTVGERERASGLLVYKFLAAYYYYFFNLINVDEKNCGSFKSFSFIYIYIYIYR